MAKSIITFKQNGNIELMGTKLGIWSYEDIWGTQGRRDKSGNSLVKGFWHAHLVDGSHIMDYTRNDVKKAVTMRAIDLVKVANTLSEEQKQINICNAK